MSRRFTSLVCAHDERIFPHRRMVSSIMFCVGTYRSVVGLRWNICCPTQRRRGPQIPVGRLLASSLYHGSAYRPIPCPHSTSLGPNQACTLFGASPGSPNVSGSAYLNIGYGLNMDDLWRRNFAFVIGTLVLFQITQMLLIEYYPVSVV